METLVYTCRRRGIDPTLPTFLKDCAEKAILGGHAGDGMGSLFETLRVAPRTRARSGGPSHESDQGKV
jgi:hypothetical protein